MYKKDKLKEYIDTTVLKVVNDSFHIRLSPEMLGKYESGAYSDGIKNLANYIEQVRELGFKYPANAQPIFYTYLVPDDDFIELLQFPHKTQKGGGRPVMCYDLDGFNSAYGQSQNVFENMQNKEPDISRTVNYIHELAHLVHDQFCNKNRFIHEGFAETLPLYTMGYEEKFNEHREALKNMELNQIYSPQELLNMEKNRTFNGEALIPNKSCSFGLTYISSYLFIRGYIDKLAIKFKIDRIQATQKFLEIVRNSPSSGEWLVFDLANVLGVPQEELLNSKQLQIETLEKL